MPQQSQLRCAKALTTQSPSPRQPGDSQPRSARYTGSRSGVDSVELPEPTASPAEAGVVALEAAFSLPFLFSGQARPRVLGEPLSPPPPSLLLERRRRGFLAGVPPPAAARTPPTTADLDLARGGEAINVSPMVPPPPLLPLVARWGLDLFPPRPTPRPPPLKPPLFSPLAASCPTGVLMRRPPPPPPPPPPSPLPGPTQHGGKPGDRTPGDRAPGESRGSVLPSPPPVSPLPWRAAKEGGADGEPSLPLLMMPPLLQSRGWSGIFPVVVKRSNRLEAHATKLSRFGMAEDHSASVPTSARITWLAVSISKHFDLNCLLCLRVLDSVRCSRPCSTVVVAHH